MNRIVTYLESKEVIFHGALALIILYVPHAGHLFKQLEHLDMTIFGFTFINWFYGIALAAIIELLILVFIINGYQKTGKAYALVSFFINALYYDYWFLALQDPTILNMKLMATSFLICLMHSLSIWQLSELFYKRLKADKEKVVEYWCAECDAGPFPNKRSLDGHVSIAHKYIKKELRNVETTGQRSNGHSYH
jgi:K+-sensing histidine kinase KdpD